MKSEPPSKSLLIVISAPSGAGKTTLCDKVLKADSNVRRAITCTTRAPRGEEKHGVDYYFLSEDEFLAKVDAGDFLEHAEVYGRHYGPLVSEVADKLNAGHDVLLNIDVQGAATLREKAAETPLLRDALVSVFLTPPSRSELERRLRSRGEDNEEEIQKRLDVAVEEMRRWAEFDYLLISETLDPATPGRDEDLRRLRCIIEAEKMRRNRATPPKFRHSPT